MLRTLVTVVAFGFALAAQDFGLWSREQTGRVTHARFPESDADSVIVASEQGVLAALSVADGSVVRRQVLPESRLDQFEGHALSLSDGVLRLWRTGDFSLAWDSHPHTFDESTHHLAAGLKRHKELERIRDADGVPGSRMVPAKDGTAVLHDHTVTWHTNHDGAEVWSFTVPFEGPSSHLGVVIDDRSNSAKVSAIDLEKGVLVVYTVPLDSSGETKSSNRLQINLDAPPSSLAHTAVLSSAGFFVWVSNGAVSVVDLRAASTSVDKDNIQRGTVVSELADIGSDFKIVETPTSLPHRARNRAFFQLLDKRAQQNTDSHLVGVTREKDGSPSVKHAGKSTNSAISLSSKSDFVRGRVEGKSLIIDKLSFEGDVESTLKVDLSQRSSDASLTAIFKDSRHSSRFLATFSDHSTSLIEDGSILWTREEALASITDVKLMDLPTDYSSAEPGDEGEDVDHVGFPRFTQRLRIQIQSVLDLVSPSKEDPLEHDRFGFNKLAVVTTATGKIFGLGTLHGRIVWSHFRDVSFIPTTTFVSRRHSVINCCNAEIVVAGRTPAGHTLLYIDALTGNLVEEVPLASTPLSFVMLNGVVANNRRILMIVDEGLEVHVFPAGENAREVVLPILPSTYAFVTDVDQGTIAGYSFTAQGSTISATQRWNFALADHERISDIAVSPEHDRMKTAARSLGGGRGYIHKYINRNLIAVSTVITPKEDSRPLSRRHASDKSVSIYVLDAISGEVLTSTVHTNARGPVPAVLSENSVIYGYRGYGEDSYKRKAMKNDISVMELYEKYDGETEFSSFTAARPGNVSQTYSIAAQPTILAVTQTRLGITSKNILAGLTSSQLISIDRRLLDAFRPQKGDKNEIGSVPYGDVIPFTPENSVVSKEKEISTVSGIVTSGTLVESTTLVLAWGLDLVFSRQTPSQTFDMLSPDFNAPLLALTVAIVGGAILVLEHFQKSKALAARWS